MRKILLLSMALGLAGCASFDVHEQLAKANKTLGPVTHGQLNLQATESARSKAREAANQLLKTALTQDAAIAVALLNDPALQAQIAQNWMQGALTAQGGRIANPVFKFERIANVNEIEYGRMIAFGLLDLLTLPQRYDASQKQLAVQQIALAAQVAGQLSLVKTAWVKAVGAEQSMRYARQVLAAADASADLARRMQLVGNFNKLARARQQGFYADAAAQMAMSQQNALATREALVRALGLDEKQAQMLTLPERLPDLPASPLSPEQVAQQASQLRLDTQLSAAQLQASMRQKSSNMLSSWTDIELSFIRSTDVERADGHRTISRGPELELRLPLFDSGSLQRQAMNAQVLVALNQHEATLRAAGSHLREAYGAYRTHFDIAKHYRDEIVPIRKLINDENVLRYNGMLIGVFELLADTREQIGSVIAAINAQQQFWLADAALQASIIGKPMAAGSMEMSAGSPSAAKSSAADH